jgi:hypothetical protein
MLRSSPKLAHLVSSIAHLKPLPGRRANQIYLPILQLALPCPAALPYLVHCIYLKDDFKLVQEVCPFERPDVLRWEIIQQMYEAESTRDLKEASRRLAFWFRSYPPECIDKGKRWEFKAKLKGTVENLVEMELYRPQLENLSGGIAKALESVDGQSLSSDVAKPSYCPAPLTGYGYAY